MKRIEDTSNNKKLPYGVKAIHAIVKASRCPRPDFRFRATRYPMPWQGITQGTIPVPMCEQHPHLQSQTPPLQSLGSRYPILSLNNSLNILRLYRKKRVRNLLCPRLRTHSPHKL